MSSAPHARARMATKTLAIASLFAGLCIALRYACVPGAVWRSGKTEYYLARINESRTAHCMGMSNMFVLKFFYKETSETQRMGGTTACIHIHTLLLYTTHRIKRAASPFATLYRQCSCFFFTFRETNNCLTLDVCRCRCLIFDPHAVSNT